MFRRPIIPGACMITLLAQAAPAAPQPSADASADATTLEEVVVTAQKRSESLQSTPLAVSAFTSEALERRQISSVQQLQYNVPSLVFAQLTGYSQLSLRGIGSDLTVTAGEPTVATFQDGVYLGQLFAQAVPSFDLERIEVLRGPQGTLYGRNSTGGTINYITKSPSFEPGANFSATLGDYDRTLVEAGVTGPILADEVAGRISVEYDNRDGYRRDLFDGHRYDANEQFGAQGSLLIQPVSGFSAMLRADATKQISSPVQQFIAGLPTAAGISPATPAGVFSLPGPVLAGLPGPLFSAADLVRLGSGSVADLFGLARPGQTGPDPTKSTTIANDFPSQTTVELTGVSATLTWDQDPVTVKSISAFRYSRLNIKTDNDGSSAAILYEDPILQTSRQFTQEFNLSGKAFASRLDWLVGGYYFHDIASLRADLYLPSLGDIVTASGSFTNPAAPPVFDLSQPLIPNLLQIIADPVLGRTMNTGLIPSIAFLGFGADQASESTAVFSQGTYSLTDKLRLTAGLRYTRDDKHVLRSLHSNFVPAAGLCDEVRSEKTWNATTGVAGIDYDLGPQTLAYGKVSRGYKAGGFNPAECTNSFNPETLWAYEAGLKSTFWDGQARVNLAGFYYKFDDIQFTTYLNNASTIKNAASATLYGVEVEHTVVPRWLPGVQFDGSGSYIHSEYGRQLLQDPLGLATLDIKGNQLIRAPRWKLNLGAQYSANLPHGDALTLRAEGSYTSTIYNDVFNGKAPFQAGTVQPPYWIANARLIWESADGRFEGQLFVENIGDKLYSYSRVASATGAYLSGQFSPPRTYGARFAVKLGSAR